MAGGPGSSGMLNALLYQAPCILTVNGTVPNENRWSERFNLIALDHVRKFNAFLKPKKLNGTLQPIGVGYSYGTRVNSSQAAAFDVYDFLQKFYTIFPHLSKYVFKTG
jgi:carboxypeptidase C (cathepsin A)